jgi:hypothetical protein
MPDPASARVSDYRARISRGPVSSNAGYPGYHGRDRDADLGGAGDMSVL